MATLRDVAKLAGVSVSAASYALNDSREVSERTRERVIEAARALKYAPNGAARDLRRAQTKTIGLVLSNLYGPFYSEIIRAIEEGAVGRGYQLLASSSNGGKNASSRLFLKEMRAAGLLVLSHGIEDRILLETASALSPIVTLDRALRAPYIGSVTTDNRLGMYKMAKFLLGRNYRRFAYMQGPPDATDNRTRYAGFLDALREGGIPAEQVALLYGDFTRDTGREAMHLFLKECAGRELPEVVVCANDESALGALEAIGEHGLRVPEDIALTGYDDIDILRYLPLRLTTVRHSMYQMGVLAVNMLIDMICGQEGAAHVLRPVLIPGDTTPKR